MRWFSSLFRVGFVGLLAAAVAAEPGSSKEAQALQESAGTRLCREGKVSRDEGSDMYTMQVRGFSFPFVSDPCKAAEIAVEGDKSTPEALAELLLSRSVTKVRLIADKRDGEEAQKAAEEILQYLNLGRAGDTSMEVVDDETKIAPPAASETIVYLSGPKAGARGDLVTVEGNRIDVRGSSAEGLLRAADRLVLELAAVFCGSKTCSDPIACAAGKKCGCAMRRGR